MLLVSKWQTNIQEKNMKWAKVNIPRPITKSHTTFQMEVQRTFGKPQAISENSSVTFSDILL